MYSNEICIDGSPGDQISMDASFDGNPAIWINQDARTVFYANKDRVEAFGFFNKSKEELKKNITKFENALDVLKSSDIYEYNYITEEDTDEKHVGFVIGKNFKASEKVVSKDKESVDLYTITGIEWKAIQELVKRIEKLEAKE